MIAQEVSEARSSSPTTICTGMLASTTRRMMESCPFMISRRSGQHVHQGLGQPSRLQRARIDTGDAHLRRDERRRITGSAAPEDRLLEPDRCRPIGVRLAGNGELVVEPRGAPVLDREAGHREYNPGLPGEQLLRIAERPQPLRARPLQEAQIVRIIDY